MVIVAGHVMVDPPQRDNYLAGSRDAVDQARRAPGCLDFAITADLLDPGRVNIYERWECRQAVEAFRGGGPGEEQTGAIITATVSEYDVTGERRLI